MKSKRKFIFIVFVTHPKTGDEEIAGIYEDHREAEAICRTWRYWIERLPVNEKFVGRGEHHMGCWCPKQHGPMIVPSASTKPAH